MLWGVYVRLAMFVVLALFVGVGVTDFGNDDAGTRSPAPRAGEPVATAATIVRVVDGDTVHARLPNGESRKVRLIGIDTPESSTLRTGHTECGGDQATRFTQGLMDRWPRVTLRTDPGQDSYDRYGRLLAYVEPAAEAGTTYQQAILAAGWAKVYVYDGDPFTRVAPFRRAATAAGERQAGIWTLCGGNFRQPLGG